jgi:transcriptional regulator with XRE-family HTH domain
MRSSEINTDLLSHLVRRQVAQSANLREAAKDAGVSPATLSRVQRGHAPDADALVALSRWLQISIEKVLFNPPPVDDATRKKSTIDKVEVHLRADPRLSLDTATRLADVFKAVYEQFVELEERKAARP